MFELFDRFAPSEMFELFDRFARSKCSNCSIAALVRSAVPLFELSLDSRPFDLVNSIDSFNVQGLSGFDSGNCGDD